MGSYEPKRPLKYIIQSWFQIGNKKHYYFYTIWTVQIKFVDFKFDSNKNHLWFLVLTFSQICMYYVDKALDLVEGLLGRILNNKNKLKILAGWVNKGQK